MFVKKVLKYILSMLVEIVLALPFFLLALISRFCHRKIDVGLGPHPLVNNIYHKKALIQYGYTAETFVFDTYFITDEFDINLAKIPGKFKVIKFILPYWFFVKSLFRYKSLFIYFYGGLMGFSNIFRNLEPMFYKIANIKIVVMPYGSDVQVMTRSKNLYFKHTMAKDYPDYRKSKNLVSQNVDRWTRYADWIVSGCEWVDYMYHWDTLLMGHFSIDLEQWKQNTNVDLSQKTLKILHAPNHTEIKGTEALCRAVDALKKEGLDIELIQLRGVPNSKIKEVMQTVDIVADQFVIGWYAMFAIEAMAMQKPVMCYLREDLLELYVKAGLVEKEEIPIINTNLLEIYDKIKWCYLNRSHLKNIGEKGVSFVQKNHSLERIGSVFTEILTKLDISPNSPR
jgi:glycosyltransferase involved in cell wall biosynthesis